MRWVSRRVMPLPGSKRGTRARPASITTRTPSMVRLVSAMLVASTTLRVPATPARWRRAGRRVELAMQRAEQHLGASAKGFAQAFVNAADLGLAGKKDQHAAAFLRQRLEHRLLHPRLDELAGLRRPSPADIHREHAALAAHHRRFAEQRRKTLALQGRRHHQHFQRRLVAQQFAAIESQRQGQVGIQAALVEFVEDHQADTVQRRVVLQATARIPSVTTSMRVFGPTLLSRRIR